MGPLILLKNAADNLRWAHGSYQKCYRWCQMGPLILPTNVADILRWAQQAMEKNY
jgi:hypothetical protein